MSCPINLNITVNRLEEQMSVLLKEVFNQVMDKKFICPFCSLDLDNPKNIDHFNIKVTVDAYSEVIDWNSGSKYIQTMTNSFRHTTPDNTEVALNIYVECEAQGCIVDEVREWNKDKESIGDMISIYDFIFKHIGILFYYKEKLPNVKFDDPCSILENYSKYKNKIELVV